ncbi:tyrosine--tRNA ligase [Candidatus Schneideria nysicola]|uniref:tyrosine--tRNA ligase n=1 Tax=Candidatus Schneideria nysicola TaxID=1081631 RepID=UPI001CAA4F6F|nr:tyrosine--tRNA ligase [Candidatus Schneideria nysicola]UAJ65014.1 tyrosine--tRNA ligase [Candidatus Schneideria nysicola]
MINKNLIEQLRQRGLISQITHEKELSNLLNHTKISFYCGFDPTSDSLHIGHLFLLLCLKRFYLAGHKPIIVIGGATGIIGDPSFKKNERKLNPLYLVNKWSKKIKEQITNLLNISNNKNIIIRNNIDWFQSMNVLTFLRDIGKHFSINHMMQKEAIRQRLQRKNIGISFTEFSYNLLQSYDFAYLHHKDGILLQIGGDDQWGNILSGINLTKRLYGNVVYGLTVPLIVKSDGSKFGKSENNTIWLDPKKTSPYKFYQFWLNITDEEVYHFLRLFTSLDINHILSMQNTEKKLNKNSNSIPSSKYKLADLITKMVHGDIVLTSVKRITNSLFSTNLISDLTMSDFAYLAKDGIPNMSIENGINIDLQQILVESKLATSRSQAKNMIANHAITINFKKQTFEKYKFQESDKLFGCYTLLRRGKKHYFLIQWK